jgi:chemotaxis protein MotA
MHWGSAAGLVLVWVMLALGVLLGGGRPEAFWNAASAVVVLGGGLAATIACLPAGTLGRLPRVLARCFRRPADNRSAIIRQLVGYAEQARREGLLSLEETIEAIADPFIKHGMQMAVDGFRPEAIQEVLAAEIDAMSGRHREGRLVLDNLGRFTPAFGMIGTLLGLIVMLGNMTDPGRIGSGMAVALLTTLYGSLLSYASFLPLAEKLAAASRQEVQTREMILKGILAIQNGEHPRIIEQKLIAYVPPEQRSPLRPRTPAEAA